MSVKFMIKSPCCNIETMSICEGLCRDFDLGKD